MTSRSTATDRRKARTTAPLDTPEGELTQRALAGDADAYGEVASRHRAAALRVAAVVLGTTEGADDVVQQALERSWVALDQLDSERAFRPWFLRIVANLARNERRSRGRRAHLASRMGAVENGVATPEEVVVEDHEREEVVAALSRLDASDRLVIALRHFEDLSEREMSEVLDCPPGTVKSRLSRAMVRLRKLLVVWVVLLVLALGVIVTPVREAVADMLGIGSTRIDYVPAEDADTSSLSPLHDELTPSDRSGAEAELGRALPTVASGSLGEPDLIAVPEEGGAILAWRRGATTLWIRQAEPANQMLKSLPMSDGSSGSDVAGTDTPTSVEPVDDLGREALLIDGDHVLTTPSRKVAASTVLLWLDDEWEYRLESALDPDTLLTLARRLQ